MLDNFEAIVSLLDFTLDTKRKRHIVGGILLSVSFMFGGLALTAMTLKYGEEDSDDQQRQSAADIRGGNSDRDYRDVRIFQDEV